jgi:hypothetical protein
MEFRNKRQQKQKGRSRNFWLKFFSRASLLRATSSAPCECILHAKPGGIENKALASRPDLSATVAFTGNPESFTSKRAGLCLTLLTVYSDAADGL